MKTGYRLVAITTVALQLLLLGCNNDSGYPSRDKLLVDSVRQAIEEYFKHYGRYPHSGVGLLEDNGQVLRALTSSEPYSNNPSLNPKGIVFITLSKHQTNKNGEFVDRNGHRLMIALNRTNNLPSLLGSKVGTEKILVWTVGKNGIDESGDGDDVTSWQK